MYMDTPFLPLWLVVVLFSLLCYSVYFLTISSSSRHKSKKLPPGPYPFPIIGNVFHISGFSRTSLVKLSQTYGPLFSLKLGSRRIIVVSSPGIAKELLQKHDLEVSGRVVLDAAHAFDHHKVSVTWLPVDNQWRNLRKLSKEYIFSSNRLNASQGLRQEKVRQLCNYVHECCINGQAVDIGQAAFTTSLNLISNTIFSADFAQFDSGSSQEIKETVWSIMKTVGTPNLSDFFPVLRAIDPQGIRRRAKVCMGKLLDVIDAAIRQRIQERDTSLTFQRRNDFLETLLDLNQQNEAVMSYKDLKHLLLDLFIGGAETSSVSVEWIMTELLRNPEKKVQARAEIMEIIEQGDFVQESDISKLPYLQALVKETFRLHPIAAFLNRKAERDIEINGYMVPKDAQVVVNTWGIGSDPSVWSNPGSFVPERFLDNEIDVKGRHFELLTFGTGRRICMGLPLADRMVHLVVASLLHKFDWKLEEGITPEDLDMTEKVGVTVQKAVPLKTIPIIRTTV